MDQVALSVITNIHLYDLARLSLSIQILSVIAVKVRTVIASCNQLIVLEHVSLFQEISTAFARTEQVVFSYFAQK